MQSPKSVKSVINIASIVKNWLNPKNPALQKAVEKTISEGLFSREDIEFQLSVLRENVENGEIEEWAQRSGLSDKKNATGKKVLCLHAGNLPLVGFQTALGVILSGADYYGKISRKDPYLLASFLEEIRGSGIDQEIHFSTNLNSFENLQADNVVFAGSEESVPEVKGKITQLKAAKPTAEYIIRTAKFSIAWLSIWNETVKKELVEAMLRYRGKGCRSVAVVVAEFGLEEVKDDLEKATQEFWAENPQTLNPPPILKYQHAYNKGIQRSQLWLEDFLIQESDELPELDFSVNWAKGNAGKVKELKEKFGKHVQSVYTTADKINELETEELRLAQRPPLWWKPDGVDVMDELIK